MQISILKQVVVLNAFSAAAATDITANGGYLYIGSAGTVNYVPRMYYPNAQAVLLKSQLETLSSWLVTGAVANSTAYTFTILQKSAITGQMVSFPVVYNSDASATDAEIYTGIAAYVNGLITSGGLKAAISGAAITTGATIIGLTGYAPITIVAGTSTTVANNLSVANVSSTNATPIVMTTAATTYAVGQVVTVSGHTVNTSANGTWRVSATNGTTTVTLTTLAGVNSVGNGVGGATGTTAKRAQVGIGLGTQVGALSTTNNPTLGTAIAADTYSVLYFDGASIDSGVMTTQQRTMYRQELWMDEAGANYAAFYAGLLNIMNGLAVGGAASEPELIAALS